MSSKDKRPGFSSLFGRAEFIVAGLFLLTFLIYLPVRHADFVYDDRWYVTHNPGVHLLDVRRIFTDPTRAAAPESGLAMDAYRPIVTLSQALDYQLWGKSAAGYHIEALILHLVNAFLVWLLFRRLVPKAAALLVVAIFLWHPVQVQSVAYITQRTTLLSSFGMLLTLLLLGPPGPWSWSKIFTGWAAFAISLFCRETAGGVILALGLLDWLSSKGDIPGGSPPRDTRYWVRYGGLLVLTGTYILIRSHVLPFWSQMRGPRNFASDAAIGLMAFAVYLGKLLVSSHLRVHYAYPNPEIGSIAAAAAVAVAYAAGTVWCFFRRRPWGAALAWIFIFLIPVLQFIPFLGFVAERYMYFSVIGYAWILGMVYSRYPRVRPVFGGMAILLGLYSARMVPTWKSDESLWAWSVRQDPRDGFAHAAYASAVKDPRIAEHHFRRALVENPAESIREACLINLSWLVLQQKRFGAAAALAKEALRINPQEKNALYNLMRAYQGLGDRARAEEIRKRLQKITSSPVPK